MISRKNKKKLVVPDFCKMYFGAPRSGKTTIAVAEAQKWIRKGFTVYTNFPVENCLQLNPLKIGEYQLENCVCIIDEAGIDFNNRNYKTLAQSFVAYIKLHGHYHTSFIFLSQGWDDCDKKIRTICTEYWYVRKFMGLSYRRQMLKRVGISDVDHSIIDEYYRAPVVFGGLKLCFRRRWYRYFNSWDRPRLPDYERIGWPSSSPHPSSIRKK